MTRLVPVTLLRATAAVLAVYGYVVALWLTTHDLNPQPVATIREWVNRPLGVGEDFGPFAVMLLLVCTGYTAAATGFTVRRLVLVCLPALVAAILAAAVAITGLEAWTVPGGIALVPLAWVTGLQAISWLVALDERTWPTTLLLFTAVAALCLLADVEPMLGRPLLFLPLVLIGHVTWRVLDRTLPAGAGVLLGVCCVAAILGVERAFPELARWWYPVAASIAVPLFLAAVRTAGPTATRLAAHPVTRFLAGSAEWALLVGGVVTFAVLGLVTS
ncbi:hypothetical protein [Actinophytocola sp.]|uniref:hypothetical protein n=1 Tax=Actinophytocola sp. TaxID=1872138 RepID=UPI002ED1A05B